MHIAEQLAPFGDQQVPEKFQILGFKPRLVLGRLSRHTGKRRWRQWRNRNSSRLALAPGPPTVGPAALSALRDGPRGHLGSALNFRRRAVWGAIRRPPPDRAFRFAFRGLFL